MEGAPKTLDVQMDDTKLAALSAMAENPGKMFGEDLTEFKDKAKQLAMEACGGYFPTVTMQDVMPNRGSWPYCLMDANNKIVAREDDPKSSNIDWATVAKAARDIHTIYSLKAE